MEQGPWVAGFLVSNSWSIGGKSDRVDVDADVLQPWPSHRAFQRSEPAGGSR
jgi:hypothetical protein